jgi:hypothetical protein
MPTDLITVDQDRLRTVQKRVRELLLAHEPWLRERFRTAFGDYMKLNSRRAKQTAALWRRQWKMARTVLSKGYLHDPALKRNHEPMIFDFEGECPKELATRLQAHMAAGKHAPKLPPKKVAKALFAFDLDMQYQIGRLSDEQRKRMAAKSRRQKAAGTHVSFHWQFWLAKPSDWPEDASPHAPELSTLSEEDYFTVALYNLGGLADTDSQRPLIPKPRKGGGGIEYLLRYFAWEARFPVAKWGETGQESELDVVQFPPLEAEQMLAFVESWIRIEVARRAESLPPGGAIVSPVRVDEHGRGVDTADPDAIDRVAEQRAEMVVETTQKRKAPGIGGTDIDWKDVQGQLLAKRERGEPYTSLRKLVAELGCSDGVIRKAIIKSVTLRGWQARSMEPKAAPKATDVGEIVIDNARQTAEAAPHDVLLDDERDAALAQLMDKHPESRAEINAMSDEGKAKAAKLWIEQRADAEPSPLEPDKPGERPRTVRQHKRV